MWPLKTTIKIYLITPGILPKVEISTHYNIKRLHLKMKAKYKNTGADKIKVIKQQNT